MDKSDIIREINKLEQIKLSLNTVIQYLSNPDIFDKLTKVNYILSNDYLVDKKNNKLETIKKVLNSKDDRVNSCNDIIYYINIKIRKLKQKLESLDSLI